jgi:PHD-like zinc-binding domain
MQIGGLDNIKPENVCMTCAYCRQRIGATVKCAHTKCHTTFHPLCARKVGCFSLCHHSTGRGRPTYKTWCAQHSDAAKRREKDAPTKSAAVNGEKRATGGPKQPPPAPEPTVTKEDLAELEAQLKFKNDALAFLRGVRYDLEAARILAAQVCNPSPLETVLPAVS